MPRRKIKEKNIRKITKVGKKSYAVTLPIDIIRRWRWKERQKVVLKINERTKTITIKDWPARRPVRRKFTVGESPKGKGGKK